MSVVKKSLWRIFGTLITDRDEATGLTKISFGRFFLTLLMVVSVFIWTGIIPGVDGKSELPSTMVTCMSGLMVYVLGSKGVSAYRTKKPVVKSSPGHMPE